MTFEINVLFLIPIGFMLLFLYVRKKRTDQKREFFKQLEDLELINSSMGIGYRFGITSTIKAMLNAGVLTVNRNEQITVGQGDNIITFTPENVYDIKLWGSYQSTEEFVEYRDQYMKGLIKTAGDEIKRLRTNK